jgi:hypothetical protein
MYWAMALPPNNRTLSNAMILFQQNPGAETAKPLYEALLGSTLVLLTKEAEAGGGEEEVVTDIASSGGRQPRYHFRLLRGSGGRVGLPAFTDPQAMLLRYPDGGRMLFMPAAEIARELAGSTRTLVLNPTSRQPSGVHIPRQALAALAEGRVPDLPEHG